MPAAAFLARRWRLVLLLAGVGMISFAVIGAALCRLTDLNCHLRSGDPFTGAAGKATGATQLPARFEQEVIASGLDLPTTFALLPDERILVGEKDGAITAFRGGRRLGQLTDLSGRLATRDYRGLLEIEPAPDFARTGHLYLLYVYDPGGIGERSLPTSVRVSRITVGGNRAPLATERVIVGRVGGRSCNALPAGSDCIPCDQDHCGGDIEFARDGSLLVTTGEGWWGAAGFHANSLRAQKLDSLGGKLLRMTPNGLGRPDNPFWNGDARSNRSRVWAYGFRHPFRMTLRPASETPYVGDVGWNSFEEIDVAVRGGNFGWPCYEGSERPPEYKRHPVCRAVYARGKRGVRFPLVTLPRGSVTGGVFYTGEAFPERYRGAYFYGDWSWSWLRALRMDARDRLRGDEEFATEAAGPVQLEVGRDGALYYLSANAGELRRVTYRGD